MFDPKPVISSIGDLMRIAAKINRIRREDADSTLVRDTVLKNKLTGIRKINQEDMSKTIKWL